ncbi:L,D-transpeptidase [Ahrensia sp. R2A130]|uniref:L,D-transpeptidase family protein n=1 Tax=Ahrensia sp. R2A130 TaxID=744979 RepID=UPI0001E08C9A|nr:L,D-transpeptidase family protein [Ahrensia sp. R2A130]EFL88116.1 putative cytoplasmic protein [Ahrensia sp. R2A130]
MLNRLYVKTRPGCSQQGLLRAGNRVLPCALGRSGIVSAKREGDGGTPIGEFRLMHGYFRADRGHTPQTLLPMSPIEPTDGWCDAVGDRNYNCPVQLPYPASHELMMRDDRLYDVVIVMDYNITRRMSRGGSAIFFHIAKPGYPPTEGCVAISPADMAWLLPQIGPQTIMFVGV